MKIYAPKYYNEFVCIADKCRHSCCIGWEIDIDAESVELYYGLTEGYGKIINDSICRGTVPHFKLSADGRCPHLNENGLCKIILNLGEDHLCDICREHPRFYNYTRRGKEVGLGLACEEAGRLILTSDGYAEMEIAGETDENMADVPFDTLPFRNRIYEILSSSSISYKQKLDDICREFNVSPAILSDTEWHSVISNLEYLDDDHKKLFSAYSTDTPINPSLEKILERAFAYFVYRHTAEAYDEEDFRASLGFCMFCERLLASVVSAENTTDIGTITLLARIISEELEYSEDNTEAVKLEFAF